MLAIRGGTDRRLRRDFELDTDGNRRLSALHRGVIKQTSGHAESDVVAVAGLR
jgi:hypothetical protein